MTETREQFMARYPRPEFTRKRVLVRCECFWMGCGGWAWGYAGDLSPWETEVEET